MSNTTEQGTIVSCLWEQARLGNLMMTTREIQAATSLGRDALNRALALLVSEGLLGMITKGNANYYYLPQLRETAERRTAG